MSINQQHDHARSAVLGAIRAALRDVPREEQPEQVPVTRNYREKDETTSRATIIQLFAEHTEEYKANVRQVEEGDLPNALAAICQQRSIRRLVLPEDIPDAWIPTNVEVLRDGHQQLTQEQVENSDGVLMGCAVGIAQTGTIVLDGGALQGRRLLSLLPDHALCVISSEQIVALFPEAIRSLHKEVITRRAPITFISGPSATVDIEMSLVEGVHGPRTLDVFVI